VHSAARFLIILGLLLMILGAVFLFFPKFIPFKLPGDIVLRRDNLVVVFPLMTGIVLSIIITIIVNFLLRK